MLVAVTAAIFAIVFRGTLHWVLVHGGHASDVVTFMAKLPGWARVSLPMLGGLFAGLLGLAIGSSREGSGIAGVMEAVVLGRVRLSMRSTLVKSAAAWIAIATGGSIGREGPLIPIGGSAGKLFGDRLGLSSVETRTLVACGTAAGFAAAYNTPFAAILFVLEVVTGVVVLEMLVPTLIATVIAAVATRAVVGDGPVYGERSFHLLDPRELIAFVGLGIFAALASQGFMRLLSNGERGFSRLPIPWRSALGGALCGGIVAFIPEVAGNGYEPLNALLDGRFAIGFVAWLVMGKCVATTASVSSGSPGGVFTPTLLIGGGLGLLYASGLLHLGLAVGPAPGYALVGMAAATAAVTHAPLMAAVMVFELSGDYAIALPLVLATAAATLVSRSLRRESIYGAELRASGSSWEMTIDGRRTIDGSPP